MKFEHLLKIYWSRGLYYNGRLFKLNWTFREMFGNLSGLAKKTRSNFMRRFECGFYVTNTSYQSFLLVNHTTDRKKIINMYMSQITNTSNDIYNLTKLNLIRLYLIKSFRGRAQMLGKPSRGQRTWSNAWTAYRYNNVIKHFVNQIIKSNKITNKIEKINYKVVKKKLKKRDPKIKMQHISTKKDLWF